MFGGMFFLEPLKPQIKLSTTDAASDLKACEKCWRHLKALLLGPPFYKQILVQETFGLAPDSSISSLHRLHICSMPHVADVQMGICLLYSSLSCKWKRIKRFHHSQSPSHRAAVSRSSHKGHDWARFSLLPGRQRFPLGYRDPWRKHLLEGQKTWLDIGSWGLILGTPDMQLPSHCCKYFIMLFHNRNEDLLLAV